MRLIAHALSTLIACLLSTPACAQNGPPVEEPSEPMLIEVAPGVRTLPEGGMVEFDGFIAMDCHNPETPDVYLEVIACRVDSREHEALVATRARASSIHAAMLAAGFVPGTPAQLRPGATVPPKGDAVVVQLIVKGQPDLPTDPREWIRSVERDQTLKAWEQEQGAPSHWVFAGSEIATRALPDDATETVYAADFTGQVVGLHTFGTEVIAWSSVLSPQASELAPEWIADNRVVPKFRTPVVVRLTKPEAESQDQAATETESSNDP